MNTGDGSVPTGPLPNNSIVIARDVTSGDRISFQCRSGSPDRDVGQFVNLDGSTFNIAMNSGVFIVQKTGSGSGHPGSVLFRNRAGYETLTAEDEGVYTCRIPDETGSDVDVNIGVYRNGFNSTFSYVCKSKGNMERYYVYKNMLFHHTHVSYSSSYPTSYQLPYIFSEG